MTFREFFSSIRGVLLGLSIFSIILFISIFARSTYVEWNKNQDDARLALDSAASEVAFDLSIWIDAKARFISDFAKRPAIKALSCDQFVSEYIILDRTIASIAIIDPGGAISCLFGDPVTRLPPEVIRERDWFKAAVSSDRSRIGNIIFSSKMGKWLLAISAPIHDDAGIVTGIVVATYDTEALQPYIKRERPANSLVGVLDGENRFVGVSSVAGEMIGKIAFPEDVVLRIDNGQEGNKSYVGVGPDGKRLFVSTTKLPGTSWTIFASQPENIAFAFQRTALARDVTFLLIAVVFIIGVGWSVSYFISVPIVKVADATLKVASGSQNSKLPIEGPIEIRSLITNFNSLIKDRDLYAKNLEESEARYRNLLNGTNAVVWEADAKTFKMTFVSEQVQSLLGYAPNEWMSAEFDWTKHIHPDDIDAAIKDTQDGMARGGSWGQSYRVITRDNRIVWVRNLCTLVPDAGVIRGLTFDITKQVELERALAANDARNRAIIDASPVPSLLVDENHNIVSINSAFLAAFGYTLEDIPTTSDWLLRAYPDAGYRQWVADEGVRRSQVISGTARLSDPMEVDVCAKDGRVLNVIRQMTVINIQQQRLHLVTLVDLTQQKQADAAQKALSKKYSNLVTTAADPILTIDRSGVIQLCNPSAQAAFGYDEQELVGQHLHRLLPSDVHGLHQGWVEAFFSSSDSSRSMCSLRTVAGRRKDGSILRLQVSLSKSTDADGTFATAVIRDITDRVQMEEQLKQSEKLAAVGQLTGGVAHDVNNDLAVVLGSAELILEKAEPGSRLEVLSKRIIGTVERSASLVQRMLAFSRKANIEPVKLDLSKTVGEIVETMRRTLAGRVSLRYTPPVLAMWVNVDRSMLESWSCHGLVPHP